MEKNTKQNLLRGAAAMIRIGRSRPYPMFFVLCSTFYVLCSTFLSPSFADVTFKASVDKTQVPIDDIVTCTITLSGPINNIPSPTTPVFDNLSPISNSQASSVSIVNGQVNSSVSFVIQLKPIRTGKANIGASTVTVSGNTYTTTPIAINIVAQSGMTKTMPPRSATRQMTGIDEWDDFFNNFFTNPRTAVSMRSMAPANIPQADPILATTKVSKFSPYINEQTTLTFTFYRRINLIQSPSYTPPNTVGFWSVNLPISSSTRQINIKGINYLAQDLHTAIFPTKTGNIKIGSALLSAVIDPFYPPMTIKTDEINLKVKPLPEDGKPATFSGAVGKFNLSVSVDKQTIERGKPLKITAKIAGEGNIKTVTEPTLLMGNGLKRLSSTSKQSVNKGYSSVSGEKVFDIFVMPVIEGKTSVEAVVFSYFDPSKERYMELKSDPFSIEVLPSTIPLPKEYSSNSSGQQSGLIIDINFRKVLRSLFFVIFNIYILYVLISGAFIFAIIKGVNYYNQTAKNKADKLAKNALKTAKKHLRNKRYKESVITIYDAIARYLGNKLTFSSAGITTELLKDILIQRGIPQDLCKEIDVFMNECDMIRFTPSNLDTERTTGLLKTANELLFRIEFSLHNSK